MKYTHILLLPILFNLLLAIGPAAGAGDCGEASDAYGLSCGAKSCGYLLDVKQAGFYVLKARLPEGGAEGYWGMSVELRGATMANQFHVGAILKEDSGTPGFFSTYLEQSRQVTMTLHEYTGQVSRARLRVLNSSRETVHETIATVEETVVTPPMESAGRHIVEIENLVGEPRGRFGLSVETPDSPPDLSFGGWLDAVTSESPEGFGGFYLTSGKLLIRLEFGETYGDIGADKPDLSIHRLNEAGELELFWQPPFVTGISQNGEKPAPLKPVISADGRFVAYLAEPAASDGGGSDPDPSVEQVHLYDRQTGRSIRISNVSGPFGIEIIDLAMSADGRCLAYLTSEYSPGPSGGWDKREIWLYEVETGGTTLIMEDLVPRMGPSWLDETSISGDGRYLVYDGSSTFMLYDRVTGVHRDLNLSTSWKTENASISADGRRLVFESSNNDLTPDDLNPGSDVFVQTLDSGEIRLVSRLGENYPFIGHHFNPSISADGRFVVFVSTAEREQTIYLYDAQIGVAKKISPLGNAACQPSVSDDGRYIVFSSSLKLDEEATERRNNLYLLEVLNLGFSYRTQSLTPGVSDDSLDPVISGDGRFIAFYSYADDLIPDGVGNQPGFFMFLDHQKVRPVNMTSF